MSRNLVVPVYNYDDSVEVYLQLGQIIQVEEDNKVLSSFYVAKSLSDISGKDFQYAIDNGYIKKFIGQPMTIPGDKQFLFGQNNTLHASGNLQYDDQGKISVGGGGIGKNHLYVYSNGATVDISMGFDPSSSNLALFFRGQKIGTDDYNLSIGNVISGSYKTNLLIRGGKHIRLENLSEGFQINCPSGQQNPGQSITVVNISSEDNTAKTYLSQLDVPAFILGGVRNDRNNRFVIYWTPGNGDVYKSNIYGSKI